MNAPFSSLPADRRALFALAAGAVAVGASPIFLRLGEMGPFAAAFHRAFLAIPAIAVWLLIVDRGKIERPKNTGDAALMALAGFFFAGDLAFWHLSLFGTAVANATLFANTAPVFVVLIGWVLFRQTVTKTFVAGMALALLGAICLIHASLSFRPDRLTGDAYGVVTAMFLAGYLLTLERLRRTYGAAVILFWSTVATAVCLLVPALIFEGQLFAESAEGWLMLLALAWISQAAGQGLIAYALAVLPASITAVGLLLEPVAAALLAGFILHEGLGPWQLVGGVVVLAGIALARLGAIGDTKN
tara:strand:- start:351 stop:1256 length:906 start_codon:yes stop_codon:yes gene_type:complete